MVGKKPKPKRPIFAEISLGEKRAILSRTASGRIANDLRLISLGEKSRTFKRKVRRVTRRKLRKMRRRIE